VRVFSAESDRLNFSMQAEHFGFAQCEAGNVAEPVGGFI
jgi:hypothetical protein